MGFCKSDGGFQGDVGYAGLSGGDHDVGHGDDDGDVGRQLGYQLHHQLLLLLLPLLLLQEEGDTSPDNPTCQ